MTLAQITTIIFLFSYQISSGISEYQPNDKLYTWASSGLNLRASPNLNSTKIITIAFGDMVICQGRKSEFFNNENSLTVINKVKNFYKEIDEINIKGNWVKVKFEEWEGYIFDGYLSKWKPQFVNSQDFKLLGFLQLNCDSFSYLEKRKLTSEQGVEKISFHNGCYLRMNYTQGGFSFRLRIPDFSIEEAFLLIQYLDNFIGKVNQEKDGSIKIFQELGGYQIQSFKNVIFVIGEWGN